MSKFLGTNYEFAFVGRDEGGFVENYAYDLGEGNEQSGKLYITIDIEQNAFDAEKVGEIIFDNVRKIFFADLETDPYERFEESLKEVNKALNEYRGQRDNTFLGKINAIVAVVVGPTLYLTQVGEAEAYLIRKRLTTTISDDLDEGSEKEVFTNIASGEIEKGDFILLSSTRLLRYISKTELAKLIEHQIQDTMLSLKEYLHGEVLSKVGLLGVAAEKHDSDAVLPGEGVTLHEREESFKSVSDNSLKDEKAIPGRNNPSFSGKEIKTKIAGYYSAIKDKVADFRGSVGERVQRGSQREPGGGPWSIGSWGRDKILIAIVVLILVLTVGIFWLKAKGDEDARVTELSDQLVTIRENINSAITTGQFDKDKAAEMLNNAEQGAIEVYNSGYHKAKSRELLDLILETRDELDGVIRLEPEMMADLSAKRDNVEALGLVYLNNQLYAYEYNALYRVSGDGAEDPLTIDDNESVISAINYDDNDSILFFTESDKVIEYVNDRMSFLSTSDENFKNGVALQAYSNKIYVLDSEGGNLWRYTRRRDAFDAAEDYAVGADLANTVDLAIDGNIYVLHEDGNITRLYQGAKEDFPIKKQPVKPLTSPTRIFTETDLPYIYVLEPSENRVLAYAKDDRIDGIVYDKQYIFDELTDLKDVYVDKDTNTMYILTKKGVYRTAL